MGEEILPFDQSRTIEQTKFIFSTLEKVEIEQKISRDDLVYKTGNKEKV